MEIKELNEQNIPVIAELMARIKPDWWDGAGAITQLQSGTGWYGCTSCKPKGWILCKLLAGYKTFEIECLGYDDGGAFKITEELQPLVETAESWAKSKGCAIVRYTMGSSGFSCHRRVFKSPWQELRDIQAVAREEFCWFLSMGYIPAGVLPNIYGDRYHGIMLVKEI